MSRFYKVCIVNQSNEDANEIFAIKPYLESFDSFKDEIFIRMPELKNQPLKIYYQDADGDNITIFNALDFGIFQDQKINKVFVVKNTLSKSISFQEPRCATTDAPPVSTSATTHRVHHQNIVCDGCDKEIYGYRYKCVECLDFDLCMECEPKMHNHHLMIRIADPNDADLWRRSKLGKRLMRHRRSESLCSKSDEKEFKRHHGHHGHHQKRHASANLSVRPPFLSDIVCDVLHSFAGNNADPNNQSSAASTAAPKTSAAADASQVKKSTPTNEKSANPTTSANAPPYGFSVPNGNGKPPCAVPLKHGIDMLSHVAHNFAAMMDPFATFFEQGANAYASAASSASAASNASAKAAEVAVNQTTPAAFIDQFMRSSNGNGTSASASASASASVSNSASVSSAKAPEPTVAPIVNVSDNSSNASVASQSENVEPMTGVNSDQGATEKSKDVEVMIVDCSDDEEAEALRNLVTSLNVDSNSADVGESTSSKKDNEEPSNAASIDSCEVCEKGSPSREWTFIDRSEVAESAGAHSGAIPKKSTPTPAEVAQASNGNNVDYVELSRLLSSHIETAQKQLGVPAAPKEDGGKTETDGASVSSKSAKTPPPTPLHPDARVNESLNAMIAMGFSNEGGWLTQLLETVDGSISNALDLLQPHK